jgi:hypothetical protein
MSMLSALLSIISGALAGGFAALVVLPVQQISDLRRQAQEAMILYGRLQNDASPAERQAAADMFRRIGAGFVSHYLARFRWTLLALRCLTWRKLDIHSAGELLLNFYRLTHYGNLINLELHPDWEKLRKSLALPPLTVSPVVQANLEAFRQMPGRQDPF